MSDVNEPPGAIQTLLLLRVRHENALLGSSGVTEI